MFPVGLRQAPAGTTIYGKRYMGIDRATFFVGSDGRVAKVWRGVKVPGHVEEVLAAARGLATA